MSQSIDGYKLSYNISKQPKTRFREVNFGQGYRQIIVDGLNADEEMWSVTFIPMDSTDSSSLESILLDSVTAASNFISWTAPGETTTKYWTAHEVSKIPAGPTLWQISCSLRREFILGA